MIPNTKTPNNQPSKDKKVEIMVFNPQQIKQVRLTKILNVLKAHQGKVLSVEEIAYYVGLDTKTTRKYLRLLRNMYPNDIKWVKSGVKTYYVYKPNEKSMEELSKLVNKKNFKAPKTIIALNVKDMELLERLQHVDVEALIRKLLEELAKTKEANVKEANEANVEEPIEDNIEDTIEDNIEDSLEDSE
jgi:predicted transcriptional regulator